MRALVYHGPGQKAWEEVADPEILDDGDIIVRVDATTICGTDLHILKGDVPAVHEGRILGHEAVGTVWEVGDGVRRSPPATGFLSPASAPAAPAGSAARAATGSAWKAAAGSSATRSTAPRPSSSACCTRTTPRSGSPRG